MKPDWYEVLDNWGNALSDRARRETGEKADSYFARAEEKYRKALRLRPAADNVMRNLKNLLIDWAMTKSGIEAERLVALTKEIGPAEATKDSDVSMDSSADGPVP